MGGRTIPYTEWEPGLLGHDDYGFEDYADPQASREVTVSTLSGPHATVAEVQYDGLTVAGDAKRNNGERTQQVVGRDLAIGRAFIELGTQLIDRAYDRLES